MLVHVKNVSLRLSSSRAVSNYFIACCSAMHNEVFSWLAAVPDDRIIIDGDMLAQYLHLPLLIQWGIAKEWGERAGVRLQPTAIASMLKDEFGLGVG